MNPFSLKSFCQPKRCASRRGAQKNAYRRRKGFHRGIRGDIVTPGIQREITSGKHQASKRGGDTSVGGKKIMASPKK